MAYQVEGAYFTRKKTPQEFPKMLLVATLPIYKGWKVNTKFFPVTGQSGQSSMPTLPSQSHTQHLDVNKKQDRHPMEVIFHYCVTHFTASPELDTNSPRKGTDLKRMSHWPQTLYRCYWCISQTPLPEVHPAPSYRCWLLTGSHLNTSLEGWL